MLTDDQADFADRRRALRDEGIFLSRIQESPGYGVVFPGHGSQYLDQLADLRWSDPAVAAVFDEADQLYRSRYGHTLSACIYTDLGATAESLSEPAAMQCAIFTASVAQFRRLMAFSAPPAMVIGHSLGEYAAYVAGGVLDFADGFAGVMARAEAVSELPSDRRGTMLAVRIKDAAEARVYRRLLLLAGASGDIGEAIVNSSAQRVVSGSREAVAAFSRAAKAQHLSVVGLRVTHAYHSPVLRPCTAPLRARLERLDFHAPSVTVLSSITGEALDQDDREDIAGLLSAQLVQPFDFRALLTRAAEYGVENFVEAGPSGVLSGIIESEKGGASCVPMDSRRRPAAEDERRVRLYLASLGIPEREAEPPAAAEKISAGAVTGLVSEVTGYPRYALSGNVPLDRLGFVAETRQRLSARLQAEYGPDFGDLSRSIDRIAARLGETGDRSALGRSTPPNGAAPRADGAGEAETSPGDGDTSASGPATPAATGERDGSAALGAAPGSPAPAPSPGADELVREFVAEFASATGYPDDVIEPDLDLEADLGVDSVKRAQVIAALASRHGIAEEDLDLSGAATIALLAQRLARAADRTTDAPRAVAEEDDPILPVTPDGADATATGERDGSAALGAAPGSPAPAPSPGADELVREFVAEFASATGYPDDVIEPDLDLEADLGVDSVKRAQVIAALASRHGIAEEDLDLSGAATIALLAQRLARAADRTTDAPESAAPSPVEQAEQAGPVESETALRYLPRAIVRDLRQSPCAPRNLRGLRLLLVPAADQDLTERTRALLEDVGADVWVSAVPDPELGNGIDQAGFAANLAAEHRRCGPRDGIVDLATYRPSRDALALGAAEFSAAWRRQYAQLFSVYREYYEDLAGAADRAVVAVLTSCGGGYGLKGATTGDALGCMSVGFVKSLAKELPELGLCLVDVDDGDRALAADRLVQELAAGSDDDEVGYLGDQRHVIKVVPVPVSPAPDHREDIEGAIVFSGGSRGIALECALALADSDLAAVGGRPSPIVILGRSRLDDPVSLPYLDLSDEEFDRAQPEIMRALHRSDPSIRPMGLQQRFRRIVNDRLLRRTIRRLEDGSAPIEYVTCDVNDADQVARVMADVRSRHGGVRGVVHTAGLESLGLLPKKNYALAEKVVETKVQGFYNLVHAVDPDALEFLVAFTSISGRFGMDGQTEYTAGAAAVSALCSQLSRRHRSTRVVALDWTAWAEVGMATHHSVQEVQEQQRGLRYLPPEEGCRHFLRELAGGGLDPQVMIFGPLGVNEPRSALDCLTADRRAVADPINRGSIVDPGGFPMVETRTSRDDAGDMFTRRLDPRLDTMLIDHLVQGSPTLPGVFHLEAMAEAAELATGRTDLMIESAEFENFVKCPEGRVCDLEITVSTGEPDRIETAIRADVVSPKGVVLIQGRRRSHAVFAPRRTAPACPYDWNELLADRATRFDLDDYYAAAAPIITFGTGFRKLREAWRTSRGVLVGRFGVSSDTRRLLPEGAARLITEPLLLDNVGRLALIDVFQRLGDHVVPVSVAGAVIHRPPAERTEVLGCVEVQPEGPGRYAMRIHVADPDGTPLIEVDRILLQKLDDNAARRSPSRATA